MYEFVILVIFDSNHRLSYVVTNIPQRTCRKQGTFKYPTSI